MIALVIALLCARIVLAGVGFVLGLVLGIAGVAVELSYVILRWVVYPISAGAWTAARRVVAGASAACLTPTAPSRPGRLRRDAGRAPMHGSHAPQCAVLAGVLAARV